MSSSEFDLGPLDSLVGFHLRRASFVFSPDIRKTKGVPRGLFSILSVVSTNPGINQTSLSEALGIDKPNLVPLLDGLVKRGLLTRAVHAKDRRARVLNLTAKGQRVFKKTQVLVRRGEDRMLSQFSKQERVMLLELLRRMHSQRNSAAVRAIHLGVNAST